MVTLFIGGARSGKSAHAERFSLALNEGPVAYFATLEDTSDETAERIRGHRARREHRPFDTQWLMRPDDYRPTSHTVALLDGLGVLVSQTMFLQQDGAWSEQSVEDVVRSVSDLLVRMADDYPHLIVVAPDVFRGDLPTDGTARYMEALGRILQRITGKLHADLVESVAGILVGHRVTDPSLKGYLHDNA